MDDDHGQRVEALIRDLASAYPRFGLSNATAAQYVKYLSDWTIEHLERTLDHLVRTSTFFPSIAEILVALDPPDQSETHTRTTGYRLVRGTHGSTYISDPEGTDHIPQWIDAP